MRRIRVTMYEDKNGWKYKLETWDNKNHNAYYTGRAEIESHDKFPTASQALDDIKITLNETPDAIQENLL